MSANLANNRIFLAALDRMLHSKDDGVRREAAVSFLRMGRVAVPILMAALRSRLADTRLAAAWTLGELQASEAAPALVARLKDADADVRLVALEALGSLRISSTASAIQSHLADPDLTIRWYVTKALADLRDRTALNGLIAALRDDEPIIRDLAAHALAAYWDEEAITALVGALADPEPLVRATALRSLRWGTGKEATLRHTLGDANAGVRLIAAQTFRRRGAAGVVPELINIINDEDPAVRHTAVAALSTVYDLRAIQAVTVQLEDADAPTACVICWAILMWRAEAAIPVLARRLRQPEPLNCRAEIAYTLTQLGPEAVEPLLETALFEEGDLQAYAVQALGLVQDPTTVPALLALVEDADPYLRALAARAVGWPNNIAAVDMLTSLLDDGRIAWQDSTAGGLRAITVSEVIAQALTCIGAFQHSFSGSIKQYPPAERPLQTAPPALRKPIEPSWTIPIRHDRPPREGPGRRKRLLPGDLYWR